MTRTKTNNLFKLFLSGIAIGILSFSNLTQAAIIYDGAETSGVTTDDQYIIDYDDTSTTNIALEFGSSGITYLRYNISGNKFEFSHDVDFQSNQLLNARVQNVSGVANIPACLAPTDAGKVIFITSTFVNILPNQTLTVDNYYICNTAGNLWLSIPTGFNPGDYLRSNDNTTYVGGGIGQNTLDFGNGINPVNINFNDNSTVHFDSNAEVDLSRTSANTFTFNYDAANGDTTSLVFGDGSGVMTFNDTTGQFTFNNKVFIGGDTTIWGNLDMNLNQITNMRIDNVGSLPACNGSSVGRIVFLTSGNVGEYICDGFNWIRNSIEGTTGTLEFSAAFKDGVVRPDGTNNVGTMTQDTDTINNKNFYRWTTNRTPALHDLDIVVDVRLPDDFKEFASSNNFVYDFRSTTINPAQAKMDISGVDTAGAPISFTIPATNIVPGVANTWTSTNNNINGGTFNAGDRMQLTFKLSSRNIGGGPHNFDLANFRLNYIKKAQ